VGRDKPKAGDPTSASMTGIANPKNGSDRNWYSYYAGFSEDFVRTTLAYLRPPPRSVILDPWNGSGTTTTVARDLGCVARGYDLNPVMVVVAKARLLDAGVLPSIASIMREILAEARHLPKAFRSPPETEPLALWLVPPAAASLRAIERGIQRVLVSYDHPVEAGTPAVASALSTLAAFFYVCLFQTVRAYLSHFYTTNPTWVKAPLSARHRLRPRPSSIAASFRAQVKALTSRQRRTVAMSAKGATDLVPGEATIAVVDSVSLPDADDSADVVVSSPPYCTRIDYAIATKPELAVLGVSSPKDFAALRNSLIGSTALGPRDDRPDEKDVWGPTCLQFLDIVRSHASKASATYYLSSFRRYFHGLHASLKEINRVLKPASSAVLVVQDSWYKGQRTDLESIVREMAENLGWAFTGRVRFAQPRTMAAMNPRHRAYRHAADATESVLFLRK
jgi:DNA modification methylase